MLGLNQKRFVLGLAENAPSIVFLALLQMTDELRIAGWLGAAAAGVTLAALLRFRVSPHPILLAINLYILLVTPAIEAFYFAGFGKAGDFLLAHARVGVLLSVMMVGCALTLISERGFIGVEAAPKAVTRRFSLYLIAASAAAAAWSASYEGNRVLAIALPLAVLFGIRQFLIAGLKDRGHDGDALGAGVAPAAGVPPRDAGEMVA